MQSLQWPQGAPWQRLKSEVSRQNPFWLSSSMKLPWLLGFRSPMRSLGDPDDLGQGLFPLKSFDWCPQKSETMKLYLKRAPRDSLSLEACVHAKLLQSCLTLCDPMDCSSPGSSVHVIPGKNTGVGCHFLFQGIFPTQGSNPHLLCLLTWQVGSFPLAPPGKPCMFIYTLFWGGCVTLFSEHRMWERKQFFGSCSGFPFG